MGPHKQIVSQLMSTMLWGNVIRVKIKLRLAWVFIKNEIIRILRLINMGHYIFGLLGFLSCIMWKIRACSVTFSQAVFTFHS